MVLWCGGGYSNANCFGIAETCRLFVIIIIFLK